jgi:5-methylcytosine-specific restriction endonuclease McrA
MRHERTGRHQVKHRDAVQRRRRGYALSRMRYDALRRRDLEPGMRQQLAVYRDVLAGDPCSYCGATGRDIADDHIDALGRGGADEPMNLTAACRSCNASKKAKPLLRWMLTR